MYGKWLLIGIPLFFALSLPMYGQLEIEWEKILGGSGDDVIRDIQPTPDGGYILVGFLSDYQDVEGNLGSGNYRVVKLDAVGNLVWGSNFGGNYGAAVTIQQTTNGGYIIGGYASSTDDNANNYGLHDYWVVKLDSSGQLMWERNYGGSANDELVALQQTSDGGYMLAGSSKSSDQDVGDNYGQYDVWIVKLDANGQLQWERNLGGNSQDLARDMQLTDDGGYILAGYTRSIDQDVSENHGSSDCWVIKLDSLGQITWERTFGGLQIEMGNSVRQTQDGGYIVVAHSDTIDVNLGSYYSEADVWILKLDALGEVIWEQKLGGSANDFGDDIVEMSENGGFIVAASSYSADQQVGNNYGDSDVWIFELDSIGHLRWEKNFGGSDRDEAMAIQQTTDGGYIVGARSWSSDHDLAGNYGGPDIWIIKLKPIPVSVDPLHQVLDLKRFMISPNPSRGKFSLGFWAETHTELRLQVVDPQGKSVYQRALSAVRGDNQVELSLETLPAGVYLINLENEQGQRLQRKFVLQRD